MTTTYYVKRNNRVHGPMTGKALKRLATEGKLNAQDLVSNDQENWIIAAKVGGLTFGIVNEFGEAEADRAEPVQSPNRRTAKDPKPESAATQSTEEDFAEGDDFMLGGSMRGMMAIEAADFSSSGIWNWSVHFHRREEPGLRSFDSE
ncbi:MAG: DUF4339 domain-containing protein [Planctomycetaceae bacterium]